MADKKGLFDDESDDDFVPGGGETMQPTAEPTAGEATQAQEQNPYPVDQPAAHEAFDEGEYQPQNPDNNAQAPSNSYGEESKGEDAGHPIGFGAERANLMQEEHVSMPAQEEQQIHSDTAYTPSTMPESQQQAYENVAANQRLDEETQKAKSQFLDEINQFNAETGDSGSKPQEEFSADQLLFTVTDPVKVGSVIKYSVVGQDAEGRFETQRRFKEFYTLRKVLQERWPGCYIPCIPEKKSLNVDLSKTNPMQWKIAGNKDGIFVEERRALLERFLRELSKYDFIIESKEFKIFSRGGGEVDEVLAKLPKQSALAIIEKYRLNFKIDEDQDQQEMTRYREKINIFQSFLRKAIIQVERQKQDMKAFMIAYDKSYEHYGRIYAALMKYEDTAIDYYADGEINARNITHPGATEVKDSILTTIGQWKNPYRDAYIWIKGEMLDLLGMMDAMDGREDVLKAQMALESNKREKQVELEKMSLGKTTLKSFFKSKGTIEKNILSYQADVEAANHEVEEYRKLINFITIYHGHLAIDAFKRNKQGQYQKMLNTFSVREISNAHLSATLYHSLLELNEKK